MEGAVGYRLLQTFLGFKLNDLDGQTKAALRRTNKHFKPAIDATVLSCVVEPGDLCEILDSNWPNVTTLEIRQKEGSEDSAPSPMAFRGLLFAIASKFPLLTRLSLDKCTTLVALPINIGEFSKLNELFMGRCTGFMAFPPSLGQLTALTRLQICDCTALTLEGLAPLKHLQQLRHLKINRKPVDDPLFPEWICNNITTSLQQLELSAGLTSWPPSLDNFKHLTTLVLGSAAFSEIPEAIGNLHTLKRIAFNSFDAPPTLPTSFSKLTAVEELGLCISDMDAIGPLQHMTGLKFLNLEVADSSSLDFPNFFGDLTSLTSLQLCNNDPNESLAGLSRLTQLKSLHLEFMFLQALPESLGDLCALTELSMSSFNAMEKLPEAFSNLVSLKHLYLTRCEALENLPESFGNLPSLETLQIAYCYSLENLPLSIGKLKSLKRLVITHSGLTSLPEIVGQLSALEELRVIKCSDFIEIPESFADLIWGKAYEKWRLKRVNFSGCPKLVFSPKIKVAVEFMKYHGVYQEDLREFKEIQRFSLWESSFSS
jgi:Leucine-rich repeat (LRR) protein